MAVEYFKKGGIGVGAFNFKDLAEIKKGTKDYLDKQLLTFEGNNLFYFDKSDTASADNGGTVLVDGKGRRLKRVWDEHTGLSVDFFGAKADGSDDSGAIQQAMYAMAATGLKVKFTAGKTYYVASPINIPIGLANTARFLEIEGYGAKIKATTAVSIFNRMPVDSTEANAGMNEGVIIKGIDFIGNGTAGQKGIFLGASYGSRVEDCHFQNLDTACEFAFCLMGTIDNCRATNCITDNFILTTGNGYWTGATNINSQSNTSTIRACRVFGKLGATSHYKIIASSGVVLYDCISEGANPQHAVYYNTTGISVVKMFQIKGFHLENTPSVSGFYLRGTGGIIEIDGIFYQYAQQLINNVSDSSTTVMLKNMPWFVAGTTIRYSGTGSMYRLEMCATDFLKASTWINTSNVDTAELPFYFWGTSIAANSGNFYGSNQPFTYGVRTDYNKGSIYNTTDQGVKAGIRFNFNSHGNSPLLVDKRNHTIDLTGTTVKAGETISVVKTIVPYAQSGVVYSWNGAYTTENICVTARWKTGNDIYITITNYEAFDVALGNIFLRAETMSA